MLQRVGALFGYALEARDGRIGKVTDLYFDDHAWRVRYLVAETGGWLSRKAVLISPWALDSPGERDRTFPVKLTQQQVRDSPPVDTDQPVSRQMEEKMGLHYGWPAYWLAETESLLAGAVMPALAGNAFLPADGVNGDPHLRSALEVTGYSVHVIEEDDAVGTVTDFLVDDEEWTIRYVLVDPKDGGPERQWILNPWWTRDIDWAQRRMLFDLTGRKLRASPPLAPDTRISRDMESAVHRYYDRPGYW